MLTKEMLRASVRKGKLYPQFIKEKDVEISSSAEELLDVVKSSKGRCIGELKKELEESFESVNPCFPGLVKLVLDKCEVEEDSQAILDERWSAFQTATSSLIVSDSYDEFKSHLAENLERDFDQISGSLYSDLPEFKKIVEIPDIPTEQLISKYNIAQVQGHLLRSQEVEITLEGLSLVEKRRLMRFVKFHSLIAEFEEVGKDSLGIKLSGPLSIFNSTGIYGTKLANFFPRILEFPKWQLKTEVTYKKKPVELDIKACKELKSYLPKGTGYVPLELENFAKAMKKADSNWSVKVSEKALNLGGQNYCFPDFELTNRDTKSKLYMEIFHKWHEGQLAKRLKDPENVSKNQVILAIPRVLAKKTDVASLIGSVKQIEDNLLFYVDFPTPSALKKLLKKRRQEV